MFAPIPHKYDNIRPDMEKLAYYVNSHKGIIEQDDFVPYAIKSKISPDAVLYLYEFGTCESKKDLGIIYYITEALMNISSLKNYVSQAAKLMQIDNMTPEEYIELISESEDG